MGRGEVEKQEQVEEEEEKAKKKEKEKKERDKKTTMICCILSWVCMEKNKYLWRNAK